MQAFAMLKSKNLLKHMLKKILLFLSFRYGFQENQSMQGAFQINFQPVNNNFINLKEFQKCF
jgi:hypothetical protein